ncbi:hypothetical protein RHGRI_010247 [Rhododendron griersonianum]|uniref:S-adenosylmethionine-dependent methyltransferase n=1 Tax=Rhododendron griersonianum TaxID=479676 RepID=A0AAV6KIH2_9ERIC|nr:hypothetical protein RHGRI_010247 [Rhododendron griersonianum]
MQRGVIDSAKAMIFQTFSEKLDIEHFSSPRFNASNSTFRIADLGCSTGPNTFIAVQNIIDAIMLKYQFPTQQTHNNPTKNTAPEFHVFFNDHVDNDFNTLFKNLPASRLYSAAGVPGSFYNPLFPAASLHVAHCSYALQWLSRIPPGISEEGSPAWNKGKIYCAGNEEGVTKAYFGQFQADMDAFLKARAQELVVGGLVVIQIPGVPDCAGVISEEKMDSFNFPLYMPSSKEVETVVEMNKCFTIEKTCTLSNPVNSKSGPLVVEKTSASIRSIMENLMRDHFGSENMDQLFHLFAQKLQKNQLLYENAIRKDVYLFVLLKRKGNF